MDMGEVGPPIYPNHQHLHPIQQLAQAQDVQETGQPNEKPRTKVSRACDECRRKKVRILPADIYLNAQLIVIDQM